MTPIGYAWHLLGYNLKRQKKKKTLNDKCIHTAKEEELKIEKKKERKKSTLHSFSIIIHVVKRSLKMR